MSETKENELENIELEDNNKIEWNDAIETLIKEQGEKALAYNWLHTRCEKKYSHLNNYIAIPCIVMSTISGSASIASNQFGDNMYIPLGIGAFSILVGILSTINSYFSWAKRAENHRISALNYSKLYLFISIELSLPRDKRMNPRDFIKVIREQIERLGEISPPVADDIIKNFKHEFDGKYPNVSKPEITNGLIEIKVYKEPPPVIKEQSTQTDPLPAQEALPAIYKEPGSSIDTENASQISSVATLQTFTPLHKKMTRKQNAWK
jgi:hypothetical protein